jgi:D-glycerate 3-kinase
LVDGARTTYLPRFDKAADDRASESDWPEFVGRPEAILLDGWCLGATAPAPSRPLNEIEEIDRFSLWRGSIDAELQGDGYPTFFSAIDALIYLQAPNWEIVRAWRGQQEEETLGRALTPAENAALDRFVMHYERLTRSMLAGGHRAGWIVHLDEARNVTRIEQR